MPLKSACMENSGYRMRLSAYCIFIIAFLSSCAPVSLDDEVTIRIPQSAYSELRLWKDTLKLTGGNTIDTAFYQNADFFFRNTTLFDHYPRGKHSFRMKEYSCNPDGGNMLALLAEAAWYTGLERNSDLFYPPLGNRQNKFSADYVRLMSEANTPTCNVDISKTFNIPFTNRLYKGMIGFGSWATEVEFRDIQISKGGKTMRCDIARMQVDSGSWRMHNDVLLQDSRQLRTRVVFPDFAADEYTLTFQARRTDGEEGFLLYFGLSADGTKGYYINVGGWGNNLVGIENLHGGAISKILPCHLKNNRWYNMKLVCTPRVVQLYMEERLIMKYDHSTLPLQFYTAGYDKEAGEVIVKVVNAAETSHRVRFRLEGSSSVEAVGSVTILSASQPGDENTVDEPERVIPRKSEFSEYGNVFDYEFFPYSYTIMRIKAKK